MQTGSYYVATVKHYFVDIRMLYVMWLNMYVLKNSAVNKWVRPVVNYV